MPILTTQSARSYGFGKASTGSSPISAFYQIATATPTSGGTYTFSNIPQTYDHLHLRVWAKDTRSPVYSSLSMQFNGDTAGNYWYAYPEIDERGSNSVSGAPWLYHDSAATVAQLFEIPGNSSSNYWGSGWANIYNYSKTDRHKNVIAVGGYRSIGDASYQGFTVQAASLWRNTSGISSIVISNSNAWVSGTRLSLYGIKGA